MNDTVMCAPCETTPSAWHQRSRVIFVRDLIVDTDIGAYEHEHGRRQPLRLHIEADVKCSGIDGLASTVDYEFLAQAAFDMAARGHVDLVESFAEGVAALCMAHPVILRLRVKVEKPGALARFGALAGCELYVERVDADLAA